MRNFESGATRSSEEGKYDYEGFLSPTVLERFGEYMHTHRIQEDGMPRASDNWQKGMTLDCYIKSGWRHFMDWWLNHRGTKSEDLEESLCALMFNTMGYLHELLKEKKSRPDSYLKGNEIELMMNAHGMTYNALKELGSGPPELGTAIPENEKIDNVAHRKFLGGV